ncbi:hypothetical protein V8G54_006749 [Vigna mungo]|uniref:Uncharacterized protein n=1 Tax=Vigna mungo TaxID=3915 RepID=A0AAQ3S6Q3_VIGMU
MVAIILSNVKEINAILGEKLSAEDEEEILAEFEDLETQVGLAILLVKAWDSIVFACMQSFELVIDCRDNEFGIGMIHITNGRKNNSESKRLRYGNLTEFILLLQLTVQDLPEVPQSAHEEIEEKLDLPDVPTKAPVTGDAELWRNHWQLEEHCDQKHVNCSVNQGLQYDFVFACIL